jgi:hypothetical protein
MWLSNKIRLSRWKNALACLPDIETVYCQNLVALEKQITLRIVCKFGRVRWFRWNEKTGATSTTNTSYQPELDHVVFWLTETLLRRSEKLTIVENA